MKSLKNLVFGLLTLVSLSGVGQEIPKNYFKIDTIYKDGKITQIKETKIIEEYPNGTIKRKQIISKDESGNPRYNVIYNYNKDKKPIKRFCMIYHQNETDTINETYKYNKDKKLIQDLEIINKSDEIDTFLNINDFYKDSTIIINKDIRHDKKGNLLFHEKNIDIYLKDMRKRILERDNDGNGKINFYREIIINLDKNKKISHYTKYIQEENKKTKIEGKYLNNYLGEQNLIEEKHYLLKDNRWNLEKIIEMRLTYDKDGKKKIIKKEIKKNDYFPLKLIY